MPLSTQNYINNYIGTSSPEFILLKENIFAEYNFIYHINESFSIKNISDITNECQLLFKRIESKVQLLNLIMLDSNFLQLLADVVLSTLLKKTKSFQQYTNTTKNIHGNDIIFDKKFIKHNLTSFIHFLLFSNIASEQIFNGEIDTNRVYYQNNNLGEIDYYSIYDQQKLKEKMFESLILDICYDKSFVKGSEAKICLRVSF